MYMWSSFLQLYAVHVVVQINFQPDLGLDNTYILFCTNIHKGSEFYGIRSGVEVTYKFVEFFMAMLPY